MVDPTFTYLELDVNFKYNPNLTDRSSVELESVVKDTISDYNFNELEKFDGVFRHSQLTRAIDNADPSIQNSSVRPYMFMNITPSNNSANNFELKFVEEFYRAGGTTHTISSTSFLLNGETVFFGDAEITGSNDRKVIIYKVVNGVNVTVVNNAGNVDHQNGIITLNNFIPDTTDAIRITVTPNSLDLAPLRNQLISIDPLRLTVVPSVDTIALSGSSGTINYSTTSRLR